MPARISMTSKQRAALLALPETEEEVIRHHSFDASDLAAIGEARTPETRLGYALQLATLRYPDRHLRRGEVLPAIMLDHVAEQIEVSPELLAAFARRAPTRHAQLTGIKHRYGFRDLTRPVRAKIVAWLDSEAIGITDGRVLLDRLIVHLREQRIIAPGISVIERLAAEAMHAADTRVTATVAELLDADARARLDAVVDDKAHARQSRLSWLREPPARIGGDPLIEMCQTASKVDPLWACKIDPRG